MYQFSCVSSITHFLSFSIILHPFLLDWKHSSLFWVLSYLDLTAMDRNVIKTSPKGGAICCPAALDWSVPSWSALGGWFFNVHLPFLYGKWRRDSKSLTGNCCCLISTAEQPNERVPFWHWLFSTLESIICLCFAVSAATSWCVLINKCLHHLRDLLFTQDHMMIKQ